MVWLDNWPHMLKTVFFFQANVRPPHSFQIPDGRGSDCICRGTGDSRTPDRGNLQTGLSMEAPGSFFIFWILHLHCHFEHVSHETLNLPIDCISGY